MILADDQPARFLTRFTNGAQVSVADTTVDKGGGNNGFRPHALLEAALASCMSMTARMYADKHAIPLAGVAISVSLNRTNAEAPTFEYQVEFRGELSVEERESLQRAVERCPVRGTLSKALQFRERQG